MRIARVLTRLNLGGPARQVLASDPLLVARGHELRVFTGRPEPGEGDLAEELERRGVRVVRLAGLGRAIRPWRDLRVTRELRRELLAFAPEIVHTHASKAGVVGRRAAWAAQRNGLDCRTVHTFHGHVLEGYFPPATSWVLARLEERLARRTDALVAVSRATADDLARLGVAPRERFVLSPPGVDLAPFLALDLPPALPAAGAAFRADLGVPANAPLVLVLGRLAPIKRPELALSVFGRVRQELPDARLVFVGDGAIRSLVERSATRRGADYRAHVRFAGNRPDVVAALAAADVVLSTSRNEGLPVAMIEAAAAARPVVSTAVGGVAELVRNGVTGLLAAEEEGLALAVVTLLGDTNERRRMGVAARKEVAATYGAEALAQRLETLYQRLLDGSHQPTEALGEAPPGPGRVPE